MGFSYGKKPCVDADGNYYKQVKIGNQTWMAENLKTTKYRDGTPIPTKTVNSHWIATPTGLCCPYDNDPDSIISGSATNITTLGHAGFGYLYNWYAVNGVVTTHDPGEGPGIKEKELAPVGWHVPENVEWKTLTDYLIDNGYGYGGSGDDIGKSVCDTSGWEYSGTSGDVGNDQISNNSTGLTVVPSGNRGTTGTFHSIGSYAFIWTSTWKPPSTQAYCRVLDYGGEKIYSDSLSHYTKQGFSVRCVRDN